MIEAYRHLAIEDAEQCIAVLDEVLRASFWEGRAHRKRGESLIIVQARKQHAAGNDSRAVSGHAP